MDRPGVLPPMVGRSLAEPSIASRPCALGRPVDLTSSVLAPIIRCTTKRGMEHGGHRLPPGSPLVGFSLAPRLSLRGVGTESTSLGLARTIPCSTKHWMAQPGVLLLPHGSLLVGLSAAHPWSCLGMITDLTYSGWGPTIKCSTRRGMARPGALPQPIGRRDFHGLSSSFGGTIGTAMQLS